MGWAKRKVSSGVHAYQEYEKAAPTRRAAKIKKLRQENEIARLKMQKQKIEGQTRKLRSTDNGGADMMFGGSGMFGGPTGGTKRGKRRRGDDWGIY